MVKKVGWAASWQRGYAEEQATMSMAKKWL
jgi:hypothetical protein